MKRAHYRKVDDSNNETVSLSQFAIIYSRCNVRYLNRFEKVNEKENISEQYTHYLESFDKFRIILPTDYLLHVQNKKYPYFLSSEQSQHDHKHIVQVLSFLGKTKINIYKNILYAFKRHISSCTSEKLINLYQSLTKDAWDFSHIQLRVAQNLKQCSRVNLKLKNLSENKNLKSIFIYFLKNSNELWLDHSKINDKKKIEESIELLLKANDLNMLSDNITFYKKSGK